MPRLEIEVAIAGHDVERGAAVNHARMDGRVRNIVRIVVPATFAKFARNAGEVRDDLASDLDRIDPKRRERRMRLEPANPAPPALLAFVRDDELHPRGLADDASQRANAAPHDVVDQAAHAD